MKLPVYTHRHTQKPAEQETHCNIRISPTVHYSNSNSAKFQQKFSERYNPSASHRLCFSQSESIHGRFSLSQAALFCLGWVRVAFFAKYQLCTMFLEISVWPLNSVFSTPDLLIEESFKLEWSWAFRRWSTMIIETHHLSVDRGIQVNIEWLQRFVWFKVFSSATPSCSCFCFAFEVASSYSFVFSTSDRLTFAKIKLLGSKGQEKNLFKWNQPGSGARTHHQVVWWCCQW